MPGNVEPINRRPISARNTRWAAAVARWLTGIGCTPNQISLFSVVGGVAAGIGFILSARNEGWTRAAYFLLSGAGIQFRLLCNLFDGMVAVEGGLKTKSGEIFNELPDRLADWVVLLGAGYAAGAGGNGVALGWAAALLAILTAYVRALGAAAGAGQQFLGPMAKQHRMALMTTTAVASAIVALFHREFPLMEFALWILIMGTILTVVRRTLRVVQVLDAK